MEWSKAVCELEHANAALVRCRPHDLIALESAITRRDRAIQSVAALDPYGAPTHLVQRLRVAFDSGSAIRARLATIYREADGELRRINCVRQFSETRPR